MTQWHMKSKRKKTGGLLMCHTKKNRRDMGRDFIPTLIGERKTRKIRGFGGNSKIHIKSANTANVMVMGKAQQAEIKSVSANSADTQFIRRNIITKGAVIQTSIGKARVTSRPGQSGVINAVIIK